MNFARDVVERAPAERPRAGRAGPRRDAAASGRFGEVADAPRALAGTSARARRAVAATCVLTLVGNRPEWVLRDGRLLPPVGASCCPAPSSCARRTWRLRLDVAQPRWCWPTSATRRSWRPAGPACPVLTIAVRGALRSRPGAGRRARPARPVPDHVHERHRRRAEGGAARRSATSRGQRAAGRALARRRARATSSGARPPPAGRSRRATSFIAPWMRGAAALLHDARFDPHERLELLARERVNVLCMAPTEYRVIAKRATLRPLAGAARAGRRRRGAQPGGAARLPRGDRAVDPRRLRPDGDRPADRRAARRGAPARARWAARCRASGCDVDDGELVRRPGDRPDVLPALPGRRAAAPATPWRTGDRVRRDEDGFLYFEGRTDDVIISAGYRIGPFEVESALVAHPAVAEAAVVAAPDEERGAIVRAVVVLRDGVAPSRRLARDAAGPRQGADRARTSTRASSTSPPSCRRRQRQGPPRAAARAGRAERLSRAAVQYGGRTRRAPRALARAASTASQLRREHPCSAIAPPPSSSA